MKTDPLFNNELPYDEWDDDILVKQKIYTNTNNQLYCSIEKEFYPLFDNRVWTSNIEDIDGGDNFAEYCEEFFKMLDEEEYYD